MVNSNLWGEWSLVLLPSGQAKLIHDDSWALQGPQAPATARWLRLPRASALGLRGRRPVVRGTVKNPNDHPHGGRTRAIKNPRTPWARTAKKSRRPETNVDLKPLTKRTRKSRPTLTLGSEVSSDGAF